MVLAVTAIAVTAGTRAGSTRVSVGRLPPSISPVIPLADTSLTPPGWSPIGLGAIQISVPSEWMVDDQGSTCGAQLQGVVLVNGAAPVLVPAGTDCRLPPNVVEVRAATPAGLESPRSTVVNKIPVSKGTLQAGSTRVLRALGMEVDASGPLANQVLATLTHSPLSAVLSSAHEAVPAAWRPVTFGGLQFAVPANWGVNQTNTSGRCPSNITPELLALSTAQQALSPACPRLSQTAGYLAGQPGMVLSVGPLIGTAPADATCLTRKTLHICVDPTPKQGDGLAAGREINLLTAQITVPGQTATAEIEIGLTGSGLMPKQIFDSLTPAYQVG